MNDRFHSDEVLIDSVICAGFAVTPSDVTVFSQPTRVLFIGSAGNVYVELVGYGSGTSNVVIYNVPAGSILPVRAQRVYSTSTTASLITAGY